MTETPWTVVPGPTDYDCTPFIPEGDSYFPRWQAAAEAFRARLGQDGRARLGLAYGEHPREAFDLFLPEGTPAGLMVFVHGGYWRSSGREDWSHLAGGAVGRGWAAALPSYPLTPEVRIGRITEAIARALPVMAAEVAGPVALAGHSAGGHLVLRMACADVDLPADLRARMRAVTAISALTELEPLIHVPNNADWQLDEGQAEAESPRRKTPAGVPVRLVVGGAERPVFIDQARWMAEAWPGTALEIVPERHHFDVIEPLADPDSAMMADLLGG